MHQRSQRRAAASKSYAESEPEMSESEEEEPVKGRPGKRVKTRATSEEEDFEMLDREGEDEEDDFGVIDKEALQQSTRSREKPIKHTPAVSTRSAFLVHHRALFEPLLPPNLTNVFTHMKDGDAVIPKKPIDTPKAIVATLKDYQLKGLEFLAWLVHNGANGILGDEMGLGKTLQTISMLAYMKENGYAPPYLVVCPLSVLSSWEAEIKRWAPSFKFIRFHGPTNERANIKRRCLKEKFDIYLTTYEQLVAESGWFSQKRGWRCVVLDEGHKIKNEKSNVSNVVYGIPSTYRFILTGTPLQNNMQELWALLHYLYPTVFTPPTAKYFFDSFNLAKGTYNTSAIEHARKLLDLIMLRRLKSHVDLSIPPKEEHIIYLPLTPMQRFWYKRLLTRIDNGMIEEIFTAPIHTISSDTSSTVDTPPNLSEFQASASAVDSLAFAEESANGPSFEETREIMQYAMQSGKGDWAKLMNLLLQLRKVCNHPYILPNSEPEPFENGEHLVLASSKLIFLDKFLPKLFADGHRVLIFSQFTKMLDILEDFMRFREFAYARLDGRTSRPRRNLDIRLFQRKDSPYNVFLISTKAGGLGINLTTADTIIMIDSDWNPQNDLQAMARSHRIGQTKNVKVYRTICQDTVEEQMLTRLQKKLFLSLKVTAGSGRQMNAAAGSDDAMPSLSKDDLMTIFRYGSRTIANDEDDDPEIFLKKDVEEILAASVAHQKSVEELVESSRDEKKAAEDRGEEGGDFTLAGLETVKSRFFEGKQHLARQSKTNGDIASEWILLDKRVRVERTVTVGENTVLKELEGCEQWEAAPLMTDAKTKQLKSRGSKKEEAPAKPVKRARKKFDHQEICIVCDEPGHIVLCSGCPRVVHPKCVGLSMKALASQVLFFCPQHNCCICERKTQDAGGLLFRCGSCADSYCEDCLPIEEEITEIGESLPEFEALGYGAINQAFYITCGNCLQAQKQYAAAHPSNEESAAAETVEKAETANAETVDRAPVSADQATLNGKTYSNGSANGSTDVAKAESEKSMPEEKRFMESNSSLPHKTEHVASVELSAVDLMEAELDGKVTATGRDLVGDMYIS